ncbi:hypothetical protein [Sphingosinicella sp.]|uniref:hypothetical protein n=1 Tax=Sphingosinicella sp. TaxID=1917971 RepID=UPI0040379C21
MRRYRYRTKVLTGRWRESFDAAVDDAARAGQIAYDTEKKSAFRWIVPGSIEERDEDSGQARRKA